MAKTRRPRKQKMNVDAVIEMVEFRNYMIEQAELRRHLERQNAPWRRIVGKLVVLVIIGGLTSIVIAHAMAMGG